MERVSFDGFTCTYDFSPSEHCGQNSESVKKSHVPAIGTVESGHIKNRQRALSFWRAVD